MVHGNDSNRLLNATPRPYQSSLLGLSVLSAFFISFVEVAVQLATANEAFHARQIGLALAGNFALLGLFALAIRAAALPFTRHVHEPQSSSASSRAARVGSAIVIPGLVLLAADGAGFGELVSGKWKLAAVALTAFCLAIVLGEVSRRRIFRRAILLAWVICAGVSVLTGRATWRHLEPWLSVSNAEPANAPDRNNILVIVLDTLRFDRVCASLTPNLDRLSRESIVYKNAISTAPWTLPMHASLFTGRYPSEHEVSWGHYELSERFPVIAELLAERGYSTFAISNNWLLNRENGFARGFEQFLETPNDAHINNWRLAARLSFPQLLLGLAGLPRGLGNDAGSAITNLLMERRLTAEVKNEGPFYGFINYFEPHDPYHPPKSYLHSHLTEPQREQYRDFKQRQDDLCAHACGRPDTFSTDQIELMAALYDAEVSYQDAMIGGLLDSMKRLGLLESTWIIITSDHGELFGESNMVFHTASAHYQLLHVPLIVRPPGGATAKVVEAPVQPVDVLHKLAEIGGAKLPAGVTRSHPLPLDDRDATRTLAVSQSFGASITGLYVTQYRDMQTDVTRWMHWITSVYADGLLMEMHGDRPAGLYDVRADPRMERNLIEERKETVEELVLRYRLWEGQNISGESVSCTSN